MANNSNQNDQPWASAGNSTGGQQPGREVWSPSQSGQAGQSGQGGLLGNPLHSVRQSIESQISQAIDHYAGQVPGGFGHQYTPEAKKAISGILDGLQNQLEREASSRMGGMGNTIFGNNPGGQGGNQGGQL